jgi:hypothetical protein
VEALLERGYKVNIFDIRETFKDDRVTFFVGDLCTKEVPSYIQITENPTQYINLMLIRNVYSYKLHRLYVIVFFGG